ncbi:molybdenum cofactor sulfurase-like [Liolophura sinensis]|uniref:molybdenum cofactor sulfurase-like n=1 Tax=Liolophura sinensis TaxID=3198878 RepID=UPI0031593579
MASLDGYNSQIDDIRSSEFPNLAGCVYLDHGGTTLYSRSQLDAVHQDLTANVFGNPHSRSESSVLTTDTIDQMRTRVLDFLHAAPGEYTLIFTSGCTGALKLIAEYFDFTGEFSARPEKTDGSDEAVNSNDSLQRPTDDQKIPPSNLPLKFHKNLPHGKSGCFCYLLDNHTSVQGMREVAASKGAEIICFEEADLMGVSMPGAGHQASNGQILDVRGSRREHTPRGNCLWAIPAQSNFSGRKYPLDWLIKAKKGDFPVQKSCAGPWFTLLDSAALLGTSPLDLSQHKPDFVSLSFYKMFGYPTGLGALVVHRDAVKTLKKTYFGGGTVAVSVAKSQFHVDTPRIPDRFEDGTVSFLDIISLRHGFDALNKIGGGMVAISNHTFSVARYFYHELKNLHHGNGNPLAVIYCDTVFDDISTQGAVVNFNILRGNGQYAGFAEVDKLAQLHNIHLRTGCFCNIGACQKHLGLTEEQIKKNYDAGHVCGDNKDLVDGLPTGSVRITFGYMSTIDDAQKCLQFLADCFLEDVKDKPVFSRSQINIPEPPKSLGNHEVASFDMAKNVGPPAQHLSQNNVDQSFRSLISSTLADASDIVLTNIFLFPVKSCGAFEVTEWQIGPKGFLYDRNWMIISDSGVSLSQKREPKLCQLQPQLDLKQRKLILNFRGVSPHVVPIDLPPRDASKSPPCSSKVCGDRVSGTDCGDEVSDWLAKALGRPGCRLIQQACDDERQSKLKDADKTTKQTSAPMALTNQSQFLLINRASVARLQEKLQENQEKFHDEPVMDTENLIDRFRGNLVIKGKEAFEEESWNLIRIGEISFVSQGRCSRCQMVSMDQRTGEKNNEPLRTLGSWRGGKIPFGVYLRWETEKSGSSTLCVGDVVNIL